MSSQPYPRVADDGTYELLVPSAEVLYIFFRTASTLRTTRRSGSPAAKAESKSSKSTRNVKKRDASAVVYAPQTQSACSLVAATGQ